jgi:hypothetical protein
MDFGPDVEVSQTYSRALLDAVIAGTPAWIDHAMSSVIVAQRGEVTAQDRRIIDSAVESVVRTVRMRLSQLLAQDVDAQGMNPLAVLRGSTSAATEALREMGLHEVQRDEYERSALPDDDYSIGPLTWRDLGDDVHEAGINWGAWKAATIRLRRSDEGKIS